MIGNVNVLVFMFLHFTASVMVLTLAALGYMVWVDNFQSKKNRGNAGMMRMSMMTMMMTIFLLDKGNER